MSRTHRQHRRGVMLIEIVVALALVALTGTIAARLLWTTMNTGREVQEADRVVRTLDRLSSVLRRDVERAATVATSSGGVTIGSIEWTVDNNAVVRKSGDRIERFELNESSEHSASLWTKDDVVYLRATGEAAYTTWALTPIIGRGDR